MLSTLRGPVYLALSLFSLGPATRLWNRSPEISQGARKLASTLVSRSRAGSGVEASEWMTIEAPHLYK